VNGGKRKGKRWWFQALGGEGAQDGVGRDQSCALVRADGRRGQFADAQTRRLEVEDVGPWPHVEVRAGWRWLAVWE
jgi:hypothetical protein